MEKKTRTSAYRYDKKDLFELLPGVSTRQKEVMLDSLTAQEELSGNYTIIPKSLRYDILFFDDIFLSKWNELSTKFKDCLSKLNTDEFFTYEKLRASKKKARHFPSPGEIKRHLEKNACFLKNPFLIIKSGGTLHFHNDISKELKKMMNKPKVYTDEYEDPYLNGKTGYHKNLDGLDHCSFELNQTLRY